jgi:hypothetical protein
VQLQPFDDPPAFEDAFLFSAQRFFITSDRRFLPAALMPPRRFLGAAPPATVATVREVAADFDLRAAKGCRATSVKYGRPSSIRTSTTSRRESQLPKVRLDITGPPGASPFRAGCLVGAITVCPSWADRNGKNAERALCRNAPAVKRIRSASTVSSWKSQFPKLGPEITKDLQLPLATGYESAKKMATQAGKRQASGLAKRRMATTRTSGPQFLGLTQAGRRPIRSVTLDLRGIGRIGHNLPDSAA